MGDLIALGRRLKSTRRAKLHENGRPLTLTDIHTALGPVPSVFSALETYGHLPPRFDTFRGYCEYIGVNVDALLVEFAVVRRFYGDQIRTTTTPSEASQERCAS